MKGNDLKKIGNYIIEMTENLGRGQFGQVKRCYRTDQPEKKYACKVITKSQLNSNLQ